MPRKEINFNNTVIYKIVCNDLHIKDSYVGHTTAFNKRKNCHKHNAICDDSVQGRLLIYRVIRNHGGWENWSMIEIEKYPCNDNNEATSRERYWFELLNSTLNTQVPSRSGNESALAYQRNNKEAIMIKMKEKFDCDCGGKYTKNHALRHSKSINHKNYLDRQNKDHNDNTII